METTMTLAALASEAYKRFERRERDNGDSYVTLRDDAPEWLHDLVREAHGDMLPNDWRYQTIHAALGFIDDNDLGDRDDAHDAASEFADGNVDAYTADRLAWLSSNLRRIGYCDDAADMYGDDQGAGDIAAAIALGQYAESSEVYSSVVKSLADYLESIDDDGDDD